MPRPPSRGSRCSHRSRACRSRRRRRWRCAAGRPDCGARSRPDRETGTVGRSSCPTRPSPSAPRDRAPRPAFISRSERKWSALSAIPLKQCRVPSTLKCACFLTNSWTCASDVADVMRLVLYSIVAGPVAQRLSLRGLSRHATNHGRHRRCAHHSGALPDETTSTLFHDACSIR